MKDRYLCKAKRLDNGEWIVGYLEYAGQALISTIDDCKVVDSKTICQCTGLRDKNNKLIFEGDIVKLKYYTCAVVWDDYFAKFQTKDTKENEYGIHNYYPLCEINIKEVVGNIHEGEENEK